MGSVHRFPSGGKTDSFNDLLAKMIGKIEQEWRFCARRKPRGQCGDSPRQTLLRRLHDDLCDLRDRDQEAVA